MDAGDRLLWEWTMSMRIVWVRPHAYRGMIWVTLMHRENPTCEMIMFTRIGELWMKLTEF